MSRNFSKQIIVLFSLIPFTHFSSIAQNITGIWRGYFTTESYDQYKYELQLNQQGDNVSGVSYSYLTTVFYGKATLTGNFNSMGQSALVREIKTVELKMAGGSSACIMKCIFQYSRSGREEFLEGTFTSTYEKSELGIKRGGDCGSGKVYLRKVTTSDFPLEPFLQNRIVRPTGVTVIKAPVKKDTIRIHVNKPVVKTPVIVKKPTTSIVKKPTTTKPVTRTVVTTNNIPKKIITIDKAKDTIQKKEPIIVKTNQEKAVTIEPSVLTSRENELVKTLIVSDSDVLVKLYDNGVIDGDTISVYLDNKLVLSNKGLSEKPITLKLKMEEDNSVHTLTMVAENMGRIPPNTSLMIVESGEQRFDVRITSTEQKNALVRFKYQRPK